MSAPAQTAQPLPLTLDNLDITTTELYVKDGYPWEAWDLLRREAPVFWYERPGFEPFWAITKYTDIAWISRNPQIFSNRQRLRLAELQPYSPDLESQEDEDQRYRPANDEPPDLVFMDPPDRRQYRAIISKWFTPKAMQILESHLQDMSQNYVGVFGRILADRLRQRQVDVTDFVHECAAKLPVATICEMADVPQEDWEQIFRWTEVLVGSGDPEYQEEGKDPRETARENVHAWFNYMEWLIKKRRDEGLQGHDLLTALLTARFQGRELTPREIMSYIILLLAAGNETTRNSISGGVHALIEHPEQLQRLVRYPELLNPAVEEILRWTSVVIQFVRTVTKDTEIRGQKIRKGETIVMWYPSANRDEEIFEDPYTFDIGRDPNPHYAFGGYGEHFCLGANLARWEMRTLMRELIPLLPKLELAGEPERLLGQLHVGGIKRLPVRLSA